MEERFTKCVLANICLIENDRGEVVVQNRTKNDWPGLTFPGGHVEKGETLDEAMKREIKEETGLILNSVLFCGIIEWPFPDDVRYIGLVYKSNDFQGELKSSNEGEVFWMKKEEVFTHKVSADLDKIYEIMQSRDYPKR